MLRMANEEFRTKSHKADECIRLIKDRLPEAVSECIDCAGFLYEVEQQKELLHAAQFGKSFISSSKQIAERFSKMAINLRVLHTLRNYRVGMPLTLKQFVFLTPQVVVDRLLGRRMYPLAVEMCNVLKIPANKGETRSLAHWACYKVMSATHQEPASVARLITEKLGNKPLISYSEVATKAAECGRKELAIKLLENEVQLSRQVPLLVKLGQKAQALDKAIVSGNRDLIYTVILHLKQVLSSVDFHILVRKYPLAKVLYERHCRSEDLEVLEDWYVQEDDFHALAKRSFDLAFQTDRPEARSVRLVTVQENWEKAKCDQFPQLVEEVNKLLKCQIGLEDKLAQHFTGLTANETVFSLLLLNEHKLAEKVKSEQKLTDKTFTWLKLRALSRNQQWEDLKKLVKQKKLPVSMTNVLRLVKSEAGERRAVELLGEDFVSNSDKITMYTELGMLAEAAQAAFAARSLEALRSLEGLSAGKDDVLKAIGTFKAKLVGK